MRNFLRKHHKLNVGHIILIVGAVLITLRLFFPVLQCKVETNDKAVCPMGVVAFFSPGPDINYHFHKERTVTQSIALGVITLALYFVYKNRK